MKNGQSETDPRSRKRKDSSAGQHALVQHWGQVTLQNSLGSPGAPQAILCCSLFAIVALGTTVSLLAFASLREKGQSLSPQSITLFHLLQILFASSIILLNIYVFFFRKRKHTDASAAAEDHLPTTRPPIPATSRETNQSFPEKTGTPQLTSPSLNGARPVYSSAHIELVLTQIFARVLAIPRERVNGESDFFLCGGDSDSLTAFLAEIKQRLFIQLDPNDIFDWSTLARLIAFLVQKQPEQAKHEQHFGQESQGPGGANGEKPPA